MPIGNQHIWDQGIGSPAQNLLFNSVNSPESQRTNFNPGAMSPGEPAPETPLAAATTQTSAATAIPSSQTQQQQTQTNTNPYQKQIEQAQMNLQHLQQQFSFATSEEQRRKLQYSIQQALKKLQMWQSAGQKFT